MELSISTSIGPSLSPSLPSRLLYSPLKPYPFFRPRKNPTHPRIRLRCSYSAAAESSGSEAVFGGRKELSGLQPLVDALPPAARVVGSAAVAAAALAAGYALGLRVAPGNRAAGFAGAAALGAASVVAVYAANSAVPEVAAVSLHNLIAGCDDPTELDRGDVETILKRYGVRRQDDAFRAELCELYSRFLYSVIPPGAENLKGDEVEKLVHFKEALGIDDPDAANVHMEIGRRIFRERLETGNREGDVEQRRAFQKLIYVSNLVFGDASTFLLPWKRLFRINDAQVEIAIRDNAKILYSLRLQNIGKDIDSTQLVELRRAQLSYKLSDEIAAEMFKEHTKKLVDEVVSSALDVLKSRTNTPKESAVVTEELDKILAFNDLLTSLSTHPDSANFAPGVGSVSFFGLDGSDRKMDDLKLLYRAYASETFVDGRLNVAKLDALNRLRNIFGLGKREAEAIMVDVTTAVYRQQLVKYFTNELAEAPSKAAFLQKLCEDLQLDPENASKMHEDIYRQKLQQFVGDGELTEEEVEALMTFQVRLCIPQETVDAVHADICGRLFEKVLKEAITSGVDGFDSDARLAVKKAIHGLRLNKDNAMAIASKAVRREFMKFIQTARAAGSPLETATELKKLVAFNRLVVTELVSDIKGESAVTAEQSAATEATSGEEDELEMKVLETLGKTSPSKEQLGKVEKLVQTEITIKDDLPLKERSDLYETYLFFCMSGEVKNSAFGLTVRSGNDQAEFLLLKQLGGILGLASKERIDLHTKFAEQTFTKQAEVVLADGQLTKARIDQLAEMQKQLGLPAENAEKVIKKITTTKLVASIEAAITRGRIDIKQVRGMKESNIKLESLIAENLRESIFKKTIEEIFASGTGDFDEEEVYEKIPEDLSIDAEKAKLIVRSIAKTRLDNSLVQAIALLRQRNRDGVVASLNNMLACDKVVKSQPLSWTSSGELEDLYSIYLKSIPKPEKLLRLQFLLGISDERAVALRDAATEGALLKAVDLPPEDFKL